MLDMLRNGAKSWVAKLLLSVLDTLRDESTDKGPVRLILEPKSKNQDVQEMMHILLANTSLEATV